jgi:hypothetical protein
VKIVSCHRNSRDYRRHAMSGVRCHFIAMLLLIFPLIIVSGHSIASSRTIKIIEELENATSESFLPNKAILQIENIKKGWCLRAMQMLMKRRDLTESQKRGIIANVLGFTQSIGINIDIDDEIAIFLAFYDFALRSNLKYHFGSIKVSQQKMRRHYEIVSSVCIKRAESGKGRFQAKYCRLDFKKKWKHSQVGFAVFDRIIATGNPDTECAL